ncbi:MAG: hypothetical protein BAJATHORv1_40144 [Candidatus Thorarchaeota archaeon]|nr:MAG: hypothetical protein BAJATHORv1_40144 [Candidatus Thorarchaeota archaeon]
MAESSSKSKSGVVWVPRTPKTVKRSSMINLVNLLLRETSHRVTVLDKSEEPDPKLFVVTRIEWRDPDIRKPLLPQLPRLLSLLETLRGTRGVPTEIYLDSTDGIAVYLPTHETVSTLPEKPKECVRHLMDLVENHVEHTLATMQEVEEYFWKTARKKGYSPEIVAKIDLKEKHFDSPEHVYRFQYLLQKYFSIRFRIHSSESCLRVEAGSC